MSSGGPKFDSGDPSSGLSASVFVEGSEIKLAKLVSTLLGSVWMTAVAGWITVTQAIVTVHLRILDAIANLYVRVIRATGEGGAEALEASWSSAFQSAANTSPLFTPMIFSLEVVAVSAILLWARRRWS